MQSEKEKMLNGKLYDASCDELYKERLTCKSLCFEFNNLKPTEIEKKKKILSKIIGKHGENCWLEPSFWCDYGYNIELGKNFYSNHNLVILDCAKVTFGDNVFIGPNCGFYTAQHPLDVETRNSALEYAFKITVGSNVWFGGNVCIMPNVTIGDNTVIAAGSVVVKDIPSGVIAGGNPAKVIRKITTEDKYRFSR